MSLISRAIANLFNGVSQQPDSLRAVNQAEEQINGFSSIASGLRKRPPTEHIALLSATSDADAHIHTINRDTDERYVARFTSTGIEVWGLDGTQYAVGTPDGVGYLNCTSPKTELGMITVADYTFVINKTIPIAMSTDYDNLVQGRIQFNSLINDLTEGLGPVTAKAYYSVTVNGTTYTKGYTAGYTTADYASYFQGVIATGLGGTYTVGLSGSTVTIDTTTVGQTLSITATAYDEVWLYGGYAYTGTVENSSRVSVTIISAAATTTVQTFSALPASPATGTKRQVVGDPSNNFDDYYVEYDGASWVETRASGMVNTFDATTMPHVLIRTIDGNFSFQQVEWGERLVGNDESNPYPSFVGQTLNDVFFHRDRLGFLSAESLVLSRAGEYFNFWRETVTDLLDSDPIDIAASHTKVALLRSAVSFSKSLLIFSDLTQFVLTGGDVLTPSTARLEPTTEFENDPLTRPISTGQTVYFPVSKNNHIGVREYFVDEDTVSNDAADITAHVPAYLQGAVYDMSATSQIDALFVLSTTQANTMYVYKYYWGEDKKIQSAWSKWVFPTDVILMKAWAIGDTVYIVFDCADGLHLEQINLQEGAVSGTLTFKVHLDRQVELTGVYDGGNDWTTWTLPYATAVTDMAVVLNDEWGADSGKGLTPTRPSNTTVRVSGDYSAYPCHVGINYTFQYRFSNQYVRDENQSVIAGGKLTLLSMTVLYENTGYFRAEVTPQGRDTASSVFAGKVLGVTQTTLGDPALATGKFRFPILCDSESVIIDLVNDTFLPCSFQSAEWEARYILRSRR